MILQLFIILAPVSKNGMGTCFEKITDFCESHLYSVLFKLNSSFLLLLFTHKWLLLVLVLLFCFALFTSIKILNDPILVCTVYYNSPLHLLVLHNSFVSIISCCIRNCACFDAIFNLIQNWKQNKRKHCQKCFVCVWKQMAPRTKYPKATYLLTRSFERNCYSIS